METSPGLEAQIPVLGGVRNTIKGCGSSDPYLLYQCVQATKGVMLRDKFIDDEIFSGAPREGEIDPLDELE